MGPTRFTDIPNELVTSIVEFTSQNSLPALACASQRLWKLAVPILYRSVFYDSNCKAGANACTKIYDLNKFVASLEANKGLCCLVLEAKLKWGRLLDEMGTNMRLVSRLLALLTNLRTLQLLPGHIFFAQERSTQISSLHLCLPQSETVTVRRLEPLLCGTTLKNLSITTIPSSTRHGETSDDAAGGMEIASQSPVSHLSISSDLFTAANLYAILCAPKKLVSLHYRYNGKPSPDGNAISPTNFPIPLTSHQSSLEELAVYARPHQHISRQHPAENVMKSMRDFAALKRLGLPAWWMVHPNIEYKPKGAVGATHSGNIVEMLPPKLEKLQIQLEEIRLHCRNQVHFEHISRAENVVERYGMLLRWLGEIATWKGSYVHRLKEVVVWSSVPKLPHEKTMIQESGIENMFKEKDITIKFISCYSNSCGLFGTHPEF